MEKRASGIKYIFVLGAWVIALSCAGCMSGTAAGEKADTLATEIQTHSDGIREFRGSTLDKTGPIPVLTLRGSHYDRGLAYGVLLRGELREVSKINERWIQSNQDMIPGFNGPFSGVRRNLSVQQLEKSTPAKYLDEIRGLADGSGGSYQEILLSTYVSYTQTSCTAVLSAQDGKDGIFHGRNFDFSPGFLGKFPVIVHYATDGPDHIEYWNIGIIGHLAAFNGMNAAGISVSINTSGRNETDPHGLSMGWKVREILERAHDLSAVRTIVKETGNDAFTWVLVAASASEKAGIVFDLKDDIQAETFTMENKPQVVLNRAFGDGRHIESGLAALYMDVFQSINWNNERRWNSAQEFLKKHTLQEMKDVWQLLRDRNNPDGDSVFGTQGTTIARVETLFSMVFDLARRCVTIATGETYASLRTVWLFDIDSGLFSEFMPADPLTESDNFQRREHAYHQLFSARFDGTLNLDMLAGMRADELDPFVLDESGWRLKYLQTDMPRIRELLKYLAEKYDAYGYSKAAYAKSLSGTDRKQATDLMLEALKLAGRCDFMTLIILNELVDIYTAGGNIPQAADAARAWLALQDRVTRGYDSTRGWLDGTAEKMRKISR